MSSCGAPAAEGGEALMQKRQKYDKSKNCVRCKDNIGNIVVRHAVYCKNCFSPMIAAKFRRGVEPYVNEAPKGRRRLKASGNILVGLSGGVGSTVILDLVNQSYFAPRTDTPGGKEHPRFNERIWQKGFVCYVDISAVFPNMRDRTNEVRNAAKTYDALEFILVRLENAFDDSWWTSVGGKPSNSELFVDFADQDLLITAISDSNTDPVAALRTFISALPTQTAISQAIPTLVRVLLLYTARHLGVSHVLLGTSLTSLSISLISSISQGGGFTVREESDEQWMAPGSTTPIRIIKPLQDVGMKECSAWAWWHGLPVVQKEKLPGTGQDIAALTKDFIVGLEKDYPSTVSTIAKTCAKLAPKHGSVRRCLLCERPIQEGIDDWLTRTSIRSLSIGNTTPRFSTARLTPSLCYSCHTTLTSKSSRGATKSTSSFVRLPVWLSAGLQSAEYSMFQIPDERDQPAEKTSAKDTEVWQTRKIGQQEMKHAIGDFLIEDSGQ
ncbi:hypothetical protein CYLTODRAFT_345669 [Cylindrobasidium torrendii FP15055 ss-10]|uniref:Cytoplasmic tRNA 2-thiolation protein 2 n=1 Tax=Cylindrobasidium torrendii FP15055 ss-10 TaxID=1314674 RepID=A0A0D7BM21_9AGAR|nr:hypothetical protein CYLTODRAFT_345669 [Cylindrobasidium torrendii FP15055 ss-10]